MAIDNAPQILDAVAFKLLRFILLDEWQITRKQTATLLDIDLRTLNALLDDNPPKPSLKDEHLHRISAIINIYKNLRTLFPMQSQANEWIHRPNQEYSGQSALEFMLHNPEKNVMQVKRYTQAQLS